MDSKEENINQYRSMLFSIAYNMLGTIADAQDMVQETYISWLDSDKSHVENARYYLIRTISNKCISHLKKLKQQRELYTGTWLPEPLVSSADAESNLDMTKNLSIGFLYLLEKLTPIERGVIILKEAFDIDYNEVSKIFNITNETCRQHLSRAKKKLDLEKKRFEVDTREHEKILRKFLDACLNKNLEGLIELLTEDVIGYGDGGGNAQAMRNPVAGRENVVRSLMGGLGKALPFARIEIMSINGLSGAAFYKSSKKMPDLLIAIDTDDNKKIANLYFIANPEKLQHIDWQKFN
jgi:RNA polymerase sigma-70 factor (ECF subfamily)